MNHLFNVKSPQLAQRWHPASKYLAGMLFAAILPFTDAEAACTAGYPVANLPESTPGNDFIFNAGGTVVHSNTSLVWDRCALGMVLNDNNTPGDYMDDACTGTPMADTWQNVLKEVVNRNNANYLGHNDWRLPNIKELLSIVEYCGTSPSINQTVFPDTPWTSPSYFWSSTSEFDIFGDGEGWATNFSDGQNLTASRADSHHLRLVRGGQPVDSFDGVIITSGMSLVSSPASPSTYGESVTLTTTVVGNSPTGSIVFGEGGNPLTCDGGNQTLSAGQATCVLNSLAANSYNFTADYAGDVNNDPDSASLTHQVQSKILTLSGLSADDKVYDGNTSATLTGTASLNGIINGDDVTLNGAGTGTFADPSAGVDKTIFLSGFGLTGSDAGNYSLAGPLTLTATISKAPQMIDGLAAAPSGGSATLSVTASGASGNPVVYISKTLQNCHVSGNTMTLLHNNTCTVAANQSGNDNYLPAAEKTLNIIGEILQVNRTGSGSVVSDFTGIDCGSQCRGYFIIGETIELTATADPSWESSDFAWTTACASSTGNTCTLLMDTDKSVGIEFLCHFDSIPKPVISIAGTDSWKCDALQATEGFQIVGPYGNVLFEARTGIELGPEFEVGDGGIFRAVILP
jgi:hypothetical protein